MDPSEYTSGEGTVELSAAVKESGSYDPWSAEANEDDMEVDLGLETVKPKKVKPPTTSKPKDTIEVAAVVEPHQGTSYNPPVEAHTELIYKAAEIEKRKLEELERMAETKKKMDSAKMDTDDVYETGVPAGMTVDVPAAEDGDEEEQEEGGDQPVKKQPKPKTKQQRQKAVKLLAEVRLLSSLFD
jgi:nucleolar protein 53